MKKPMAKDSTAAANPISTVAMSDRPAVSLRRSGRGRYPDRRRSRRRGSRRGCRCRHRGRRGRRCPYCQRRWRWRRCSRRCRLRRWRRCRLRRWRRRRLRRRCRRRLRGWCCRRLRRRRRCRFRCWRRRRLRGRRRCRLRRWRCRRFRRWCLCRLRCRRRRRLRRRRRRWLRCWRLCRLRRRRHRQRQRFPRTIPRPSALALAIPGPDLHVVHRVRLQPEDLDPPPCDGGIGHLRPDGVGHLLEPIVVIGNRGAAVARLEPSDGDGGGTVAIHSGRERPTRNAWVLRIHRGGARKSRTSTMNPATRAGSNRRNDTLDRA